MGAPIDTRRMCAEIDGDFVVFLIGMRINRAWKVHKWLPVARAMPRMLRELEAHPEAGLLGWRFWLGNPSLLVQYWRSFDHLERYARSKDARHRPAWAEFNRRIDGNGDVGIWHETYCIPADAYEGVYTNMPRFGLARAGRHVEATGVRRNARGRLGLPPDPALTPPPGEPGGE